MMTFSQHGRLAALYPVLYASRQCMLAGFRRHALHNRSPRRLLQVEEVDPTIDAVEPTPSCARLAHMGTALLAVTRGPRLFLDRPKPSAQDFCRPVAAPGVSRFLWCNCTRSAGGLLESRASHPRPAEHHYARDTGEPSLRCAGALRTWLSHESSPHAAGARHRLCGRSPGAEVKPISPQAAQRLDHLCAGVKANLKTIS